MKNCVAGVISKVTTLADNTTRFQVDAQEAPPEVMAEMFAMKGKIGWFIFAEKPITAVEVADLPEIRMEKHERHPSERLRSVLYVQWNQKKIQEPFSTWYTARIEEMINTIKATLDPL